MDRLTGERLVRIGYLGFCDLMRGRVRRLLGCGFRLLAVVVA